jgi:hypothetical protein
MNIQISKPQQSYSPNFTGVKLDKALEIVKDNGVCRKMTKLDFLSTQMYIKSLAYKMGIVPEEVAALAKFDGEDFFYQAYDLLSKKLGLSVNIRPHLQLVPSLGESGLFAAYVPSFNQILVDLSKMKGVDKRYLFASLRHELQHFLQAADMHRHETLGPKVAKVIVDQYITAEKKTLDFIVKNYSDKQIAQTYASNPEFVDYVSKYKLVLSQNKTNLLDEFFAPVAQSYRQQVNAFQTKIKSELGVIKADSSLTPKIERNLKEFEDSGYFNADGSLNVAKWFDSEIEEEAVMAQIRAEHEYENVPCGVRKIKDHSIAKILADEANEASNI